MADNNANDLEVIRLEVVGSVPSAEEAEKLTQITFDKKRASGEEVRNGVKQCIIFICLGIGAFLFGILLLSGKGTAKLMGLCATVASPLLIIGGFVILFTKVLRSARKKKAFEAMKWVWLTSIMGDQFNLKSSRFGSIDYCMSTLWRIVPSERPFSEREIYEYVTQTRDFIAKAADVAAIPAREANKGWHDSSPRTSMTLKEEKDLYPGVKQLFAVLSFKDTMTNTDSHNNTITKVISDVEIDVCQTYVCAEGYWYPYEIMSPIRALDIPDESPQADETPSDPVDAEAPNADTTE